MSKKKPTRCPDSIDIEEIIDAHKMREEQEAFDHQLFEKEWLEQLELYSKREPRKFELHVVKPKETWKDVIATIAAGSLAVIGFAFILRMIYHIITTINA
jgi:hypothetical protein